jgi:hypothetical protein
MTLLGSHNLFWSGFKHRFAENILNDLFCRKDIYSLNLTIPEHSLALRLVTSGDRIAVIESDSFSFPKF